jgi:anaerobic ribonucleoside-triphosphate reductase activating protein
VQGCSRKCRGCFNPDTHDPSGGEELSVRQIIERIPFGEVSGVTVSGGEPFEQAEALANFLSEVGKRGLHRLVYTGFRYEELCGQKDENVKRSLALTDMLIDGAYEKDKPSQLPWTGSGNQRVLELREGEILKQRECGEEEQIDGEVMIDEAGGVTVTGIIDSRDLTE